MRSRSTQADFPQDPAFTLETDEPADNSNRHASQINFGSIIQASVAPCQVALISPAWGTRAIIGVAASPLSDLAGRRTLFS